MRIQLAAALTALCGNLVLALPATQQPLDWWQTTVFYQIYPRSFMDSDGNGVGDLKGIESRLSHLKDSGVGATWLSPIFKSPMADFGYDIANFTEIDPTFGTMQDFEKLLARAKELGIKLILDLVPNHSSDESTWFQKSVKKIDPYTNYYVWNDGKVDSSTGERLPPNNWISAFLGSAWQWNEERGQFYLHQFAVKQPDLNYRDPNLVNEMKDAVRFWLDRGVDGFRVDAVPYLFEDLELRDEPLSGNPGVLPDDPGYLNHIYTQNLPGTYDMIEQWREVMDEYKARDGVTRVMMVEAYAPLAETMRYYGTEERPGAHFPFNFVFITDVNANSSAQDFDNAVHKWMDNVPAGRTSNWVIGNHDNHRVATRYGAELADGLNMLNHLLPGVSVAYNGEEIGMVDTFITWEQTVDPSGLNAGPDRYLLYTRDPERTPFQWDNTTSAGFSTNSSTWLPVNDNYKELNLQNQLAAPASHVKVFQLLTTARKTPTIQRGSLTTKVVSEKVFAYMRALAGEPSFLVVVNLGADDETVDLSSFGSLPEQLTVYAASINSNLDHGDKVKASSVSLPAKVALVLTTPGKMIKH